MLVCSRTGHDFSIYNHSTRVNELSNIGVPIRVIHAQRWRLRVVWDHHAYVHLFIRWVWRRFPEVLAALFIGHEICDGLDRQVLHQLLSFTRVTQVHKMHIVGYRRDEGQDK